MINKNIIILVLIVILTSCGFKHANQISNEKFTIAEVNITGEKRLGNKIKNEVKNGGIFHCFSGNLDEAKKILDLGMKLGIGGLVTFKNGKIDKFLNQIDISNIVLETDSPYLSPSPLRGKRNESANIKYIAEKLCDIYNLSFQEIADITTENSKNIFGV